MRDPLLSHLVDRMYKRAVDGVIARMRAITPDARQSGDDSSLAGVWEELVVQVRFGEAPFFELYRDVVSAEAGRSLDEFTRDERALMWLWSDAYWEHDDDERLPTDAVIVDGLTEELVARVMRAADEWELSEGLERRYGTPGADG